MSSVLIVGVRLSLFSAKDIVVTNRLLVEGVLNNVIVVAGDSANIMLENNFDSDTLFSDAKIWSTVNWQVIFYK